MDISDLDQGSIDECSSKTFGFRFSRTDLRWTLAICVAFFGACVFSLTALPIPMRVLTSFVGSLCLLTVCALFRLCVPLAMAVSFRGILLVRWGFYVWMVAVLLSIGLSKPLFELLSGDFTCLLQVAFPLLVVLMEIAFIFRGGIGWLVAANLMLGVSAGLSVLGVLGLAFVFILMQVLRNIIMACNGYNGEWREELPQPLVDHFANNPNAMRQRWLFLFCNVAGVGLAIAATVGLGLGGGGDVSALVKRFTSSWSAGLDLQALVAFAATTILPLFIVCQRARSATDLMRPLSGGDRAVFFVIGVFSVAAFFFLEPVLHVLGLRIDFDPRLLFLIQLVSAYDLLVTLSIAYVDLRCRSCIQKNGVIGPADGSTRFLLVVMTSLSVVLLALALKFGSLSVFRSHSGSGGRADAYPVVLRVTPAEALEVALGRGDLALATSFARGILQTEPQNPRANFAIGRLYLEKGNCTLAVTYLERASHGLADDFATAEALSRAYSGIGNETASEKWRLDAERLRKPSDR